MLYKIIEKTNLRYGRRIKIIAGILFCALILILIRVGWIQIIQGERFFQLSQTSRLRLIPLPNPRGLIVDRKERIIADNTASFSLGVIPENFNQSQEILHKLKKVLPDLEIQTSENKIKEAPNPFRPVVIRANLDLSKVTYLLEREREFSSVVIQAQPIRNYPQKKLLGNIVGYLGKVDKEELKNLSALGAEPGDLVGKTGIEKIYNSYLQGEKGGKQIEVDAHGRSLKIISEKAPLPGNTVCLNIDLDIQKIAKEEMGERKGVVLVSNPHTGEILAILSSPSFDPNLFAKGISEKRWNQLSQDPGNPIKNRAIGGEYPPGSIFKIILTTAALDEKNISSSNIFTCNGSYKVGDRFFKCWKEEGHGKLDLEEALIHSCNVYFYQLGLKIGVKEIVRYAQLFNLGKLTGIDLVSEKKGFLPTSNWKRKTYKESWYPGDTANLSIGQGYILVTPLQMLNMINAIANGGYFVQPHLVKKIVNSKGEIIFQPHPEKSNKAFLPDSTLKFLDQALAEVVEKGTGWRAKNEIIKIAGKTGTAELAGDQNPHNWFIGYAPANEPTLSIVVLVENREEEISIAPQIVGKILSRIFENKEKKNN